jgi:hypothetical protein
LIAERDNAFSRMAEDEANADRVEVIHTPRSLAMLIDAS